MSDPVTRLNTALEGRYSIERELGEGGMATVYLADDVKQERNRYGSVDTCGFLPPSSAVQSQRLRQPWPQSRLVLTLRGRLSRQQKEYRR